MNGTTTTELTPEFVFDGDYIEVDTDPKEDAKPTRVETEDIEDKKEDKDKDGIEGEDYFVFDPEVGNIEDSDEDDPTEDVLEEPKVKDKKEPVEPIEPQADDTDDSDNLFSGLASLLRDEEILEGLGDEELQNITDSETLVEAINTKIKGVVDSTIDDINQTSHGAISHFMNGGTAEEYVKQFKANAPTGLNYSEDEIKANTEIQREIADLYLKKTSSMMSKPVRDRMAENIVEIDGEDTVLGLYQELLELEKQDKVDYKAQREQEEAARIKQQEEFQSTLRENVLATKEFIPGRKLKKEVKEKVYNNINNTVGKIQGDFQKYAPILAYLDYYNILDGDFSKITKDIQSKKNADLGETFLKYKNKSHTSRNRKTEDESDFKWAAKQSLPQRKR